MSKNYRGFHLPCKKDQGYCDPTTRTHGIFVWFPEDTCTIFQVAKNQAQMVECHHLF